jgi:hypothetical protein
MKKIADKKRLEAWVWGCSVGPCKDKVVQITEKVRDKDTGFRVWNGYCERHKK